MNRSRPWPAAALTIAIALAAEARAEAPSPYADRAREVTEAIQRDFFDAKTGVYFRTRTTREPAYVWHQAVMLSDLVAAARIEPRTYAPRLKAYFKALDIFWDPKAKVPGYEPSPTRGDGHDKYYDDNAWLAIAMLEAHETDPDPRYLDRAEATMRFVLSGWDDALGGGIWWHAEHKDGTKNACSNGPSAFGCLRLARARPAEAPKLIDRARKIVAWTVGALQDRDGLFDDRKVVATGEVKRGKLTYNSALMVRDFLALYRATGDRKDLDEAVRIGRAADWFLDKQGVYRDQVRYAHFMVEADLDLYRATNDRHFLDRARRNADAYYERWKSRPPAELIACAAIGRVLWLVSETETEAGRAFWKRSDAMKP